MLVKISNGVVETYPYSVRQLRSDNPNVSFPKNIPTNILSDYGVERVNIITPVYDHLVQTVNYPDTPTLVESNWVLSGTAVNLSETDSEENVRAERDRLLLETDEYALSDRTMTSEMTAYRQALRDVPTQSGFPFSVMWPTNPEAEE
jgi:hypothetical protein